jgi:hypothetical protein
LVEPNDAELCENGVFACEIAVSLEQTFVDDKGVCGLYGIRYHIITLVAVFLALGLGLLLGGTLGEKWIVQEQGQLLKRLEDRFTQARTDDAKWQKQAHLLEQRTRQLEHVSAEVGGHYVQDRLRGQKVAILELELADLAPLKRTLEQAGVEVIQTVQLTSQTPLFDPHAWPAAQTDTLGIEPGDTSKSRMQKIAERFVQELYVQNDSQMVSEWMQINALTISGAVGVKPDHVIVIGGARQHTMQRMLLFDTPLLRAIAKHDLHAVVAETTTTQHSGIRYYRDLGVSTVDDLDQLAGRIALVDLLGGATGHYGTKKTAQALLPTTVAAKEVSTQP